MSLKVYAYKGCGTCQKAFKYLSNKGIAHAIVPIREQPPSKAELKKMLARYDGKIRELFNIAGGDYRRLNLKDRLTTMLPTEAIDLLAGNGNLVKRPFVINGGEGLVGFKQEEWDSLLKKL